MIIKLNEQYKITTDALNYILEEKKVAKEKSKNVGQEYWLNVGYYPSLESTLKGIIKRQIQTTEVEGIKNIIDEIKTAVQVLQEQIEVSIDGNSEMPKESLIDPRD